MNRGSQLVADLSVRGRRQIAGVLAVFGVILLGLAAPPWALACAGPPLTLDEIGRAAQSVVLVEVIEVGTPARRGCAGQLHVASRSSPVRFGACANPDDVADPDRHLRRVHRDSW